MAPARVVPLGGCHSMPRKAARWIPGQGTLQGLSPWYGVCRKHLSMFHSPLDVFLSQKNSLKKF